MKSMHDGNQTTKLLTFPSPVCILVVILQKCYVVPAKVRLHIGSKDIYRLKAILFQWALGFEVLVQLLVSF
jgi:hypothetical protein